jgi:hypothetical protein
LVNVTLPDFCLDEVISFTPEGIVEAGAQDARAKPAPLASTTDTIKATIFLFISVPLFLLIPTNISYVRLNIYSTLSRDSVLALSYDNMALTRIRRV